MEQAQFTLAFPDVRSAVDVAHELGKHKTHVSDSFRVVMPVDNSNVDSELIKLAITFMEHGGLLAIAAFLNLLRDILKRLFPDKTVKITRKGKEITITSTASDEDIKKLAKDLEAS